MGRWGRHGLRAQVGENNRAMASRQVGAHDAKQISQQGHLRDDKATKGT